MKIYKRILGCFLCLMMICGCGKNAVPQESTHQEIVEPDKIEETSQKEEVTKESEEDKVKKWEKQFEDLELAKRYKEAKDNNPIMTQSYGADPYAMVYKDEVYFYMTADAYEYDGDGLIKENSYSKIKTIRVVSTKDMANFTDHGEIRVASTDGRAKWAHNSWAPAAAWKEIDGKPRFFLYFADAGGGIGVLQADSPVGPFTDPLGKGLITRDMPTCSEVLWLFDPAVLVDDDGKAYIYFGGGVPEGKISHPQTARVAQLGEDMISIVGEPKMIDAPYLFEDSGIHKYNNKYYYTYCSNWNVDEEGTKKYGFVNAEIISMESDSPMGPFVFKEKILENPGKTIGLYGNNHHCVFNFKDQWYMTYHSRILEKNMGVEKGYRCTNINPFEMGEDGTIGVIKQDLKGSEQLSYVNPYEENSAVMMAVAGGVEAVPSDMVSRAYGSGEMALGQIDSGDFVQIKGVDFAQKLPKKWKAKVRKSGDIDESCIIQLRLDTLKGEVIGYLPVGEYLSGADESDEFMEMEAELIKEVKGVHDLYMVFSGSGYEVKSWQFDEVDDWYDQMLEKSIVSEGNNGRLEKVMGKLKTGEKVNVAFIGGSVTEGGLASAPEYSYADRVIQYLKGAYKEEQINYLNAGLSGTPSTLGVMRYQRDVVETLGTTPDLVFIEFAINDYEEATKGRAYEGMVRDILEADENTAVVLVFSVSKSKWNLQDVHIPIGEQYGLPMVSVKDAIAYGYEENKLTDGEYFADDFHPVNYGHQIMADCIVNLLKKVENHEISETSAKLPETAIYSKDFSHMKLVTADNYQEAEISVGSFKETDTEVQGFSRTKKVAFPDNFMYAGDGSNEAFKMKVKCKKILLDYKQSPSEAFGTAVVTIDGKPVAEYNGYGKGAWNNSMIVLLLDEEESKVHELVVQMKSGDEKKKFTIQAISYAS